MQITKKQWDELKNKVKELDKQLSDLMSRFYDIADIVLTHVNTSMKHNIIKVPDSIPEVKKDEKKSKERI